VDAKRLGETDDALTADGLTTLYSSRARTLVDGVYDWSRFNSLPRAFEWIRSELAEKRVGAADLVRVTLRYGDVGTIRRIGALLDREGVSESLLRRLLRALKPTTGLIAWNPASPKRGTVDRRWGVVWNDRA
jgi:predicted transcriptional regulator of viral defense system